MSQSQLAKKKRVGEYNKIKPDNIFGNIGNAAAKAADHIHITDRVFTSSPPIPFFKQYKQKKSRHSNEQYFSVGFHDAKQ